jgi:putative transposase
VKALRRSGDREMSDHRILGSGEFIEWVIKEAQTKVRYRFSVKEYRGKIDEFIARVCNDGKVSIDEIKAGGRCREASRVRARIAIGLVKVFGVSLQRLADN